MGSTASSKTPEPTPQKLTLKLPGKATASPVEPKLHSSAIEPDSYQQDHMTNTSDGGTPAGPSQSTRKLRDRTATDNVRHASRRRSSRETPSYQNTTNPDYSKAQAHSNVLHASSIPGFSSNEEIFTLPQASLATDVSRSEWHSNSIHTAKTSETTVNIPAEEVPSIQRDRITGKHQFFHGLNAYACMSLTVASFP